MQTISDRHLVEFASDVRRDLALTPKQLQSKYLYDALGASQFLSAIRGALAPGDALLLGADLVKPEDALLRAYDDPLGVTAAFNRNLLVRINRELGGTFDLDAFDHVAVWNPAEQRVEMHL